MWPGISQGMIRLNVRVSALAVLIVIVCYTEGRQV